MKRKRKNGPMRLNAANAANHLANAATAFVNARERYRESDNLALLSDLYEKWEALAKAARDFAGAK